MPPRRPRRPIGRNKVIEAAVISTNFVHVAERSHAIAGDRDRRPASQKRDPETGAR
jgi:hypothetical protein